MTAEERYPALTADFMPEFSARLSELLRCSGKEAARLEGAIDILNSGATK